MKRILGKPGNRFFLKPLANELNASWTSPRRIEVIRDGDMIIRYGSAISINRTINEVNRNILNASNKPKAKRIFIENDIPTPKLINPISPSFPCIGRPRFHQKGKSFYYCENSLDISRALRNGSEYFQEFYDKTKEYRVHVAHGRVLFVQEKMPINDRAKANLIWNFTNGEFVFKVLGRGLIPSGLCPLAVKAVKALNLDFGAVDILACSKNFNDPMFTVCEVNTAPRLQGYSLEKYAMYFNWLFNNNCQIDHFKDVKKYILREEEI